MKRRIVFSRAADRDFRRISDRSARRRLATAMDALAENLHPPDARKLAGFDAVWRIRVGGYRVRYTSEHGTLVILVLAIARRADIYAKLRRRLG